MRLLSAAVAAVLTVAVPASAGPAQAGGGVIAYERDGTVYVARPDGTGERPYATGTAPALAAGHAVVAYSVRAGDAWQLMAGRLDGPVRQLTTLPDREEEFGPRRHGVVGSTWSPGAAWLALRLMEGSTTTLGLIRPGGGAVTRLEFGHLFGSIVAWRDDTTLAVGTDTGLHLVTVDGEVSDPPGRANGDAPVAWLDAARLVLNDPAGITVLDVTSGKRSPLLGGATALARAPDGGILYARDTEVGLVDPADGKPRRLDTLPAGARVLAGNADGARPLLEVADATGAVSIQTVDTTLTGVGIGGAGVRRAALTEVARGSGLAVSDTAAYDDVVPAAPGGPPAGQPTELPAASAPPLAGAGDGDGGGPPARAGAPDEGVGEPAERSVFVRAVPAAAEVSTEASTLLTNLLLTALLMLLITFPSELFNNTLEEHYDEVRGWFRLPPRGPVTAQPRGRRLATFAACSAAAALLYGLLDPGFGMDAKSLRLYAGLLLGIVVVTAVFAAAPLAYVRRRHADRGLLRALPGTLVVAVACVALSRAVGFQPGYLYGVIGGFAFSRAFSKEEEGRTALVAATGVFAVSVLAWVLWQPVNAAAGDGAPGLLLGLTDATLATVAVGGLQGLVIGLLPLRSLQGHALSRWNRAAWAAAYGVVLFAFVHLLLRPGAETGRPSSFATWLALFVGFGVLSVAFWGWFQLRGREPVSSG